MGKKIFLLWITIFTIITRLEGRFADDSNTELKHNNKGYHFGALSDYCSCSNRSWTCCLQNDNGKGCLIFNVIESNGTNGEANFTLEFLVNVENNTILAEYIRLSSDNVMCYDIDDLGVCGKLVPNKQEIGIEMCSFVQFRINQHVIQELKMYCVQFPDSAQRRGPEVPEREVKSSPDNIDTNEKKRKKNDKKEETTERPPIIPPMPFIPFIPWSA